MFSSPLMSAFFERVRAALAPKGYAVLRELGSGGMGIVVLARQGRLDRLVAVKVIRPEMHTAIVTERFRREAVTLAGLSHPNIVPVYEADDADGFPYYTMQFLEGETVADRLRKGPMPAEEVRKVGRDLLDALELAHAHGVIHRDVKPANVFLTDGRAVLVDFGIAKRVPQQGAAPDGGEELTTPGVRVGTPGYMSPEQLSGAEATPASDLYAAALVIYEAYTGRHWLEAQRMVRRPWSGMSRREAGVLRRALDWQSEGRWPDAALFRRRLWHTRVWPYQRNAIGIALGGTVAGLLIHLLMPVPSPLAFRVEAAIPGADPAGARGDSVACALARNLDRYPDLSARCVSGLGRWLPAGSRIGVETAIEGGRLRIRLRGPRVDTIEIVGPRAAWPFMAESLADRVFGAQLQSLDSLDRSLPRGVLPKNALGRGAFQRAEAAFARGRWGEARAGYAEAAALDSTCWLCYWRHGEVGRWFNLEGDPADSTHYFAHLTEFPERYQRLIQAQGLPLAARLDSLDALAKGSKEFLFGQFRRADELFHRGPLVGRSRREAMQSFQDVLKSQADFAPALEHVAWLNVAEGDSMGAASALARVAPLVDPKDPSFATLAIVELAYAWRFLPPAEAERRTRELARMARAAGIKDLDAGARYLAGFGAPQGELAFAEQLLPEPGFARSAGLARVLALIGMGRPDTAMALAHGLAYRSPELAVFVGELAGALRLAGVDSAAATARWADALPALAGAADAATGRLDLQRRAAWMLAILEWAEGHADSLRSAGPSTLPPGPLAILLQAEGAAARGAVDSALAATRLLTGIPGQDTDDPFFRSVLHLARASWNERGEHPARAIADLVWHENSDVHGYPSGDPQPAEVDWALSAFAQWRLGSLLERTGQQRDEACRAYGGVVRLWSDGDPPYRARADSARRRRSRLGCKEVP